MTSEFEKTLHHKLLSIDGYDTKCEYITAKHNVLMMVWFTLCLTMDKFIVFANALFCSIFVAKSFVW